MYDQRLLIERLESCVEALERIPRRFATNHALRILMLPRMVSIGKMLFV